MSRFSSSASSRVVHHLSDFQVRTENSMIGSMFKLGETVTR